MKITAFATLLTAATVQAQKGSCPDFKGVNFYDPSSQFRAQHTANRAAVESASNRAEDLAAREASVGTVKDGEHCVSNNECASFIADNGNNRAGVGDQPPRTSGCCVGYPQGQNWMSFCWTPSVCNSLGQVQCLVETVPLVPGPEVPLPGIPDVLSAGEEPTLEEIFLLQNIYDGGLCENITDSEECDVLRKAQEMEAGETGGTETSPAASASSVIMAALVGVASLVAGLN